MDLSTNDFRIGFGAQSAFFAAWLRKNGFGKTARRRFLAYTGIVTLLMVFGIGANVPGLQSITYTVVFVYILLFIVSLIIGALFAAIMIFLIGPIVVWVWMAVSYLIGPWPKRTQRLRLTDTRVIKQVGESEYSLTWKEVFDLVETRKTLLIFTQRNCALIVPKLAFDTPEASQAFVAYAKARWMDAKSVF
ncbi:YcxB family protein [Asticcacaulis sp. 201]|uniref:YcxB family protein n=1 Tax=Asticcacaulis sp. 201 TaxID=3028787 RepID=UPI002916CE43|nr:YcxB family protein [Asticcacaulis sp. 201]MDV6332612.1 YcxB family protein [Asticcacaulis sp. 201]